MNGMPANLTVSSVNRRFANPSVVLSSLLVDGFDIRASRERRVTRLLCMREGWMAMAVGCSVCVDVWRMAASRRRVMAPFFIVAGKVESAAEAATNDDMYDGEGGRPTDDPREHHRINSLFTVFVASSKRTITNMYDCRYVSMLLEVKRKGSLLI